MKDIQGGGPQILQQLGSQPLHHRGPFPNQRHVGAGQHLDRFGLRAVGGCRAQLVSIGAHRIGQHVRVPAVALGLRHAMPAAVPVRPVVVGAGERLFGETAGSKPFRLAGTRTVGSGLVFLSYEIVRATPSPPLGMAIPTAVTG